MNGLLYMDVRILENEDLFQKGMQMISEHRKKIILDFKNNMPARLSLGAGILFRIALDRCNLTDKINEVKYRVHGKPYVEDTDFHFSLSHSGNYAVCAYSDSVIGADLQIIKNQLPKHTKKILSLQEKEYLDTLEETDKINSFYRLWTRKESLIKWDGRGLRIPLQEISFTKEGAIADEICFEGKTLYFKEFDLWMPTCACCICNENDIFPNNPIVITEEFLIKY